MLRTPSLLALVLLVAACDSTAPKAGPLVLVSGGNYTYTAYTTLGRPVLQGTVHLEYGVLPALGTPPQGLAGTWEVHWLPGVDQSIQVGPQVGSGQMDGVTDETGVRLAFLPNLVDSGVLLNGLVRGQDVSGTWEYTTIAGPSQTGRFTLVAVR